MEKTCLNFQALESCLCFFLTGSNFIHSFTDFMLKKFGKIKQLKKEKNKGFIDNKKSMDLVI